MEERRDGKGRSGAFRRTRSWRRGLLFGAVLFFGFTAGCGYPASYYESCPAYSEQDYMNPFLLIHDDLVTIDHGVWGNVLFWEGDFMPGIGPVGTVSPVSRAIYFFEAATEGDTGKVAPTETFYYDVFTPLVAVARSDACGFFEVELPPGTYSAFVLEGDLFYGPYLSGDGTIQKVTVPRAGGPVSFRIDIDYRATF